MTKKELTSIIKALSFWTIDKRTGDYRLPNNEKLSDYLYDVTEKLCATYHLVINADGTATHQTAPDSEIDWMAHGDNIEALIKKMVGKQKGGNTMTKKTYYGVYQNYFLDGSTCKVWQQARQYAEKPQGKAISHFAYDFYVDWFDTKEEADQFADECVAVSTMTKKTYYGVFQIYYNEGTFKVWQQARQYAEKPQGEAILHFSHDFYVDWFDTKEEADQFAAECAAV